MKRKSRLIGILLIVTAIVVTQIPAQPVSARSSTELDFMMDKNTLSKYTGTATTVSVLDDVKFIGEEAFANNKYMGSVNVNRNTIGIKHGAFANCTYLQKVTGLQNVEVIESAAFSGCENLTSITLGNDLKEVGEGVFAGCTNLSQITVPKDNHNFVAVNNVLYDDKQEKLYAYAGGNTYPTFVMPDTVKNISQYSFWGNIDLEDVVLSSNLEKIPGYAFANCKGLREITIPYSVNSIDAKAFENCVSLGKVIIPPTVKDIDPTAFDGCSKLEIIADEGTPAYEFYKRFERSDVRKVESQDSKNFINNIKEINENDSNTNEYIPSNGYIDASKDPSNVEWVPSVSSFMTEDEPSLFSKTIVVNGRAVLFINKDMPVSDLSRSDTNNSIISTDDEIAASTNNNVVADNNTTSDVIYDSGKGGYLPKYTETDDAVAAWAYYGDKDTENYTVKPGIKRIGRFSFARSGLQSINIPDGVTEIGYGAFYHCDDLKSISIPSSVEKIGAYAFNNTPFLNNFMSDVSGDKFLIVGNGILVAYSGNESNVVIPQGVKTIGASAFMGNENIDGVYIPDTCVSIDSDAFRDCKNLSNVDGANNVVHIGDRAFMGCPIGTFIVGDKVDSMGLRSVDFSNTLKTDSSKVVVFNSSSLPVISADDTTSRLSNEEYRNNVLYNVLFAVVNNDVTSFENTVLDGDKLGFSGLILNIEKDANGIETGYVNVVKNYIFSDEIINQLPDSIAIKGKNYSIKDRANLNAVTKSTVSEPRKELEVRYNGNLTKIKAVMSQNEYLGKLEINDSANASNKIKKCYSQLFGDDDISIKGYEMKLYDSTNSVIIDRFGKSYLEITMPVTEKYSTYHVVAVDEDGQLEELPTYYNENNKSLTFKCSYLSEVGIYGTNEDNTVLSVKDGRLVKNYRLDESPDTGDTSVNVKYVVAILLLTLGLILIIIPKKRKIDR